MNKSKSSDLEKMNNELSFHTLSKKDVLQHFNVDENEGLNTDEINRRTEFFGKNKIEEGDRVGVLELFIDQFKDILVIILIFAAIVSGYIGYLENEGFTDAILIITILIINAFMGFYQEWKSDKAIEELKKMVTHDTRVIRNGTETIIPSVEIVPGDIIKLEQGDRIPADGRIIHSVNLRTEEAQLTGESTEISKTSKRIEAENTPLGDRKNLLFMGTHVTYGKAYMVVTNTGMESEMGRIAGSVQEISTEPTPTQLKLERFGKNLSFIILGLMGFMMVYGILLTKIELTHMLIIAVSLAVAAIPEGLPIVITLALALGVQRMAKQKSIVKKLPAVESLGSVTTICTDKTGTLTLNEMRVRRFVTFNEDNSYNSLSIKEVKEKKNNLNRVEEKIIKSCVYCNNAKLTKRKSMGDPTEIALLNAVDEIGLNRSKISKEMFRLDEIPFDSERKQMTVVVEDKSDNKKHVFSKGAPEIILDRAQYIDFGNGPKPLTEDQKVVIQEMVNNLAEDAMRVLGFGYYELEGSVYNIYEFEEKLVFSGLLGMIDPPRPGVKEAVMECSGAGINVVMVTGDHYKTAVTIGQQIGIASSEEQTIEGKDLDLMSDEELKNRINEIKIFARISPQHKLRIVRAMKSQGQIVAMTGDGVNDAPALKGSDIGIAMGSGTDVTKETADIVLEDDNFTTIVHAVEEGRGIYDNMTKFIRYMLSSNAAEIAVIFLGIILQLPIPLIAVQILWVNLVTDGVPALALGVDPSAENIMLRPPRDPNENLLSRERLNHILLFGLWMTLITLGSYLIFYNTDLFGTKGDVTKSRTVAFSILALSQLAHSLNVREDTASVLNKNIIKNKILVIAAIVSTLVQFIIIQGDELISFFTEENVYIFENLFGITPLSLIEWIWVLGFAGSLVLYAEALKVIKRNTRFKSIC